MAIQNRRDFLKNISLLSIGLGINAPLLTLSGIKADNKGLSQPAQLLSLDGLDWRHTIFCHFDKLKLARLSNKLEKLAKGIGCKIFYGEPSSPDIIAVPHFIEIVDRNNMSEDGWKDYLIFCKEASDNIPCLIIDNRDDLKLPKNKYVERFNPADISKITSIVQNTYLQISPA
jgi:hypothetical protein